jgi:hypothetical protein
VLAEWREAVLDAFDVLNICVYEMGNQTLEPTSELCEPLNAITTAFTKLCDDLKHQFIKMDAKAKDECIETQWQDQYVPWIKKMSRVLVGTYINQYPNYAIKVNVSFPLSVPLRKFLAEDVVFGSERFKQFPTLLRINGEISPSRCSKCWLPQRKYCVCGDVKLSLPNLKQKYLLLIDAGAKLDGLTKKGLKEALRSNTKLKYTPPVNYKKEQLPNSLRFLVWNTYIGIEHGGALCMVCEDKMIWQQEFHCCHVEAECNGGQKILSNLRPGCSSCNHAMRSMNLMEYKEQYDAFKRGRPIQESDFL